jgi:hypothetical protein
MPAADSPRHWLGAAGDCLLHALSLCMWATHDRDTHLRQLVIDFLLHEKLGERFKAIFVRGERSEDEAIGAERSTEQFEKDWEDVISTAVGRREYLARYQ